MTRCYLRSVDTGARFRARDSILVTYLFTATMLGTTLPTPLYSIYAAHLSLSPTMITVIFACYAAGVLGTLQLFGRLSDHVGRRAVVIAAVVASAVSAVLFMTTENLPALLAGRLISGISAGLITGAATAYLAELEDGRAGPSRAAVLSTTANMGGLALGPLLAGVLAGHFAHPTVVPFAADLVLLAPVLLVPLLGLPESVTDRDGWRKGVALQRIGVPRQIRVPFLAAAIATLAGFALLGFTNALAGQVLSEGLGNRSRQTAGVIAFLVFAAACGAQLVVGTISGQAAELVGLTLLPVGSVILVAAVFAASMWLLVLGVVVGGFGAGLAFRAALAAVTDMAPPQRRGEVISTFFLAAYVGIAVPVVAAGVLVTTTTLRVATTALAVFIVVLVCAAGATIVANRREVAQGVR